MKSVVLVFALSVAIMTPSVNGQNVFVSDQQDITGTVNGNLIILDGGTATVLGATIKGNVIVRPGGILDSAFATVEGNVNARGALTIAVFGDVIEGNLNIRSSGSQDGIGFFSTTVFGNVNIRWNNAQIIAFSFPGLGTGNMILGNVSVVGNTAVNAITIADNEIGGNLICRRNSPLPEVSGNVVIGNTFCDD
ncbi:MAG: hypothetical protein AAF802_07635 [Planctomycetota bacterium]